MCAVGGVDAESGVLVHKRVKVEALEEAEQVVVDVEVWVEVRAPNGTVIPGIELQAATPAAEPFAAARVVSLGDDGSRCIVRWRDGGGERVVAEAHIRRERRRQQRQERRRSQKHGDAD